MGPRRTSAKQKARERGPGYDDMYFPSLSMGFTVALEEMDLALSTSVAVMDRFLDLELPTPPLPHSCCHPDSPDHKRLVIVCDRLSSSSNYIL